MRFLSNSLFVLFLLAFYSKVEAQCPQITSSVATLTGDVCPGDVVTFNVDGTNLPGGEMIDWYIGELPFSPAFGQGNYIGSSDITGSNSTPCTPCPFIGGALVDACASGSGGEADNEFFVVASGGGFDINEFYIDLPPGNNTVPEVNGDLNIGGNCSWQTPDASLMTSLNSGGCNGTFVPVSPGGSVPPGSIVLVFPSAGQTFTFDFSLFCAGGETAYILQSDCDRAIGALSNASSSGTRTYTVGLSCCSTMWTYDTDDLSSSDGAFINLDAAGNNVYSNNGCSSPPIESFPLPPAADAMADSFTYTFDDTYCNSTQNIVGYIPNQGPGCDPLTNYFEYNIICPETSFPASIDICGDPASTATFDLTDLDDIVNGNTGSPVYYFENSNLSNQINNTTAYVSGTATIFAQVGTISSFCGTNITNISLNINPGPTANAVNESLCDTGDGTANFDLFNIASQVNNFTGNTINFYLNSDATGSIATTGMYNTGTTTIYAVVTNNNSNCESAIVPINLTVTAAADPAGVGIGLSPSSGCGQIDVQLTLTLPSPGTFDIIIEEQNSSSTNVPFNNVSNGDVLDFLGVTENTTFSIISIEGSNGCTTTLNISESVTISSGTTANPAVLSDCDDGTGNTFFDLTDAAAIINGGTSEIVNYYSDAAGSLPISAADAANYLVTGNTTVYASTGTAPCESNLTTLSLMIDTPGTATIGPDVTICSGEPANLTINFASGTPPYSFDLLTNGVSPQVFNNINSSSTTIPVSPSSTTTYTIENVVGGGCAMTEMGSAEITVSAAPTVTLSPNQSICQGEAGEIIFTFTGTPPFNFTYTENNGNPTSVTENGFSYTINPTPSVTTTYSVTALSDDNCAGTTPVSTQITITASETAVAGLLTDCGDNTSSATFDLNDAASQINSGSGSPINFYTDATAMTSISAADAMNFSITGNTTVYTTIGSGTCQSNIVELDLEIEPEGTATISADEEICSGESVNLVVNFAGGSPPYSFILQSNGSTVQLFNNIATTPFNVPAQTVFFPATYTVFNAQANGCGMIEAGEADITISQTPTVDISGGQTICEGGDADISFTFTGTAPYTFTYLENNSNPQEIVTSDPVYTLNVSPSSTTTYSISSFSDANCEGTVTGQAAVTVIPRPTAEISMDGSVCEGESYDLTIDFTGNAPYSFVYTIDDVLQTELTTSDNPFTLTVNPTGTSTVYGLDMVATGNCTGTVSANTATITVSQAPTATLISTLCSADNTTYTVVFEISGGTAPYTVTGGEGNLDPTGTIFTSDAINSQANYNFSIDDALNCGPITLSGTQDCSCLNSAGTMDFPPNLTELCETELFTFTHNGDEIVEPGDVFGYIIHGTPNPELSLPFQWNPTSATFDLTGDLVLNTIYYVSAVTGNPDDTSSAPFDINDPCLSVSAGVPVVWRPNPTAVLAVDSDVCEGDDASLTFDFTGTAPFTYTYSINGETPFITQQTSDNQVVTSIPITENTTVTLENIEDNICSIPLNQSVSIAFNQNVAAVVSDTICSSDISTYQIVITATGVAPFSIAGNSGSFVGNIFTSDPIPSGDPYTFEVTDANACNTITLDGLFVCEYSCIGELGDMSLDALNLCVGETAMAIYDNTNENIEAGDIIQYVIHGNPDASLGTPILIQDSPSFDWDASLYSPNTVYYISAISGDDDGMGNVDLNDPCLLVNEGQLVSWNQGTAVFTTLDTDICGGNTCIDLTIEIEGIPNFELTISDGMGGEDMIFDFNTTITYQVCPDVETTYTITSLTANGCDGLIGLPASVTISPQPVFGFENFVYECTSDNTQYSATFDLIGGTQPYSIVSGGGTLMGSNYTSALINNNVAADVEFMDGLGCTFTVTMQNNCECMNAPAIIDTDLQELCLGEFSEIIILSDPIWGPDGVSAFLIHNGSATEIGSTVYDTTNLIFNQEPIGYIPGDTVFITPVVSVSDGNDFPDLDNSCLNIGIGFPVIWYEPSELNVPENITSCSSDCQDFTYTFFQDGEHTMELSINSVVQTFTSINEEIVVTICPTDYGIENGGIVELIPVSLVNQGGCVTNYNNSPVTQLEITTPDMTNFTEQICMGDSVIIGTTVFNMDNPTGEVILQNQANCDSIVNVNLTFYDLPEGNTVVNLCTGGSIEIGGIIFDAMNDSGSVILPDASYLGCDSLLNVSVVFSSSVTFQLDTMVCEGGSATINGELYNATNTTGSFTFEDGSYLGCDSIVEVSLSFADEAIFDLDGTYCSDASFDVEGEIFDINNPMGSVTIPMGSYLGCDSTVIIDLEFYPEVEIDINRTLCTGDSFEVGDMVFDEMTPMGTVILEDASQNGCDSTVNVVLLFNDEITANLDTTICDGDSFTINQTVYNAENTTGEELFPMGSYLGCDSVLTVTVTIAQPAIANYDNQLCEGETLDIEGTIYDADNPSGTQVLSIPSFTGCDSIAEVNLSFLPNAVGVLDTILCAGDFAIIGGVTIDEDNPSSVFTFPDMASNGCDSTLTVNASFIPATEGFIEVVLEFGESFFLDGVEFDQDNPMGEVILENASYTGCDSIVTVSVIYLLDVGGVGLAPTCFGDADGSIRVDTILYGIPPYTVTVDGEFYSTFTSFPYFLTGLEAGEYDVVFTDTEGNFNDSKILVPNAPQLSLELGDNVEIKQGETYTIEALTNMPVFDIEDLIWTPTDSLDNDTTLTVTSSILESTTYSLLLRDSMGCVITDNITIFVNEERFVYIPSAFSPNDDGINDLFTIFASEQIVEIKSLNIYDRWGNKVFNNTNFAPNDVSLGWNGELGGQKMNSSVFVYSAEIEFIDGKVEVMKGDVTLIR